ncbi:MAG: redoxin domain-containing protein [bacterium]
MAYAKIFISVLLVAGLTRSVGMENETGLIGKRAPELAEGSWVNSQPTTLAKLQGKVVLLEFWTFGCYNCRNTLPFIKAWHDKYSGPKFQIIGVHTPEFESEKNLTTVKKKIDQLGIRYPVVTDNDYKTWNAYDQHYWPVMYLIDKKGIIRHIHIGEGDYETIEKEIAELMEG